MEIIVPLAVIVMCLVLTLTSRTDTTHMLEAPEVTTDWVPPGHPNLGLCEFDSGDPPEPDESETVPIPAVDAPVVEGV